VSAEIRGRLDEGVRKLARRVPVVKRLAKRTVRLARAAEYRIRNRLGWLRRVRGSSSARLGVYVAYFDAAEIYDLHLTAFRDNTAGAFNYYVMKNCTTFSEAHRFDAIVSAYGFPRVFTSWPAHVPFSHDESLQRMVDQTRDEIIVVCDVDAFPVVRGWDDFILRELETKDAVGAVVHIPERPRIKTLLHPCFLAFRRSFLDAHRLDLRGRVGADPCCRITEYLLENGRFHEGCVTPLVPTAHEMELFPGFTHEPVFGSRNLRHGFGTTYGGLVLHLWFWRVVTRRRPVTGADRSLLVTVEQTEQVLRSIRSRLGGTEAPPSSPAPREAARHARLARGQGDDT
jgi:hypothetical protein